MKTLYVLVSDGGDGSYYPHYTFNEAWIKAREALADADKLDYQSMGCDGDGFHVDTLTLPDECTYESLGISDCSDGRTDGWGEYEAPDEDDEDDDD